MVWPWELPTKAILHKRNADGGGVIVLRAALRGVLGRMLELEVIPEYGITGDNIQFILGESFFVYQSWVLIENFETLLSMVMTLNKNE